MGAQAAQDCCMQKCDKWMCEMELERELGVKHGRLCTMVTALNATLWMMDSLGGLWTRKQALADLCFIEALPQFEDRTAVKKNISNLMSLHNFIEHSVVYGELVIYCCTANDSKT